MSWWGKVIGGALGFALVGPLGALLGAALGHSFDKGIKGLEGADFGVGCANQERIQAAFFTATFSIMGKVAKADGVVSKTEIQVARNTMDKMQLNEDQKVLNNIVAQFNDPEALRKKQKERLEKQIEEASKEISG